MFVPFGIKYLSIPLCLSLVPFSQDAYGWQKYIFVSVSEMIPRKSLNSLPLSVVKLLID